MKDNVQVFIDFQIHKKIYKHINSLSVYHGCLFCFYFILEHIPYWHLSSNSSWIDDNHCDSCCFEICWLGPPFDKF